MTDPKYRSPTRRDFVRGTVSTAVAASLLGPRILAAQETPEAELAEGAEGSGGATGADGAPTEETAPTARATDGNSRVVVLRHKGALFGEFEVDPKILGAMLDETVVRVTGAATVAAAWASLYKPTDVVGLVTTGFMNATHDELVEAVTAALIGVGIDADHIVDAQGNDHTVRDCTALLNMPALKAHWLTGIGTVIKNYIMFSGKPSDYHKENSARLGEIWQLDHVAGKTKLVLVDALRPMCSKGPQPDPRYRWAYRGLIAGTDPVAVETICVRVLQNKRDLIKGEPWPLTPEPICIEAADSTYGLGTSDPDKITVDLAGWEEEALV